MPSGVPINPREKRPNPNHKRERNEEIARRVAAGEVIANLERDYGITRTRIRQIATSILGKDGWDQSRWRNTHDSHV